MVNVQPLGDGDPRRLGDYDVTGRLGEGGQGVVYLGRGTTGAVAIKLLHAQLIEDAPARARFVREVEVTKRVARFCTAQVLEAGMAADRPYIISEYVPGPSLHHQLRTEGPRRGSALDRLAINTVTALAAIHQAGVVHRDFKPGNVLMGPDGPVVIDFGISRALDASGTMTSAVSQVVGTPAFMAPEQLSEGVIGPHTDMFAWAVTMVHAASGAPAFGHRSIPQVINRILHEEPDLGELDGRLRPVVAACLSKDPARRPTARHLMDELMGHNGATPLAGPPPSSTREHGTAYSSGPSSDVPGLPASAIGAPGSAAPLAGPSSGGASGRGAADSPGLPAGTAGPAGPGGAGAAGSAASPGGPPLGGASDRGNANPPGLPSGAQDWSAPGGAGAEGSAASPAGPSSGGALEGGAASSPDLPPGMDGSAGLGGAGAAGSATSQAGPPPYGASEHGSGQAPTSGPPGAGLRPSPGMWGSPEQAEARTMHLPARDPRSSAGGPRPDEAGTMRFPASAPSSYGGGPHSPMSANAATARLPASVPVPSGGAPGYPGSPAPVTGPPERRKGRTALVIAAVAAVLIALIAGIGAMAATGGDGNDDKASAPPPVAKSSRHPVKRRTPTPHRTPTRKPVVAKPPKRNPYTPQKVCGAGYRVLEVHRLGDATTYLLYNGPAGINCVVTMVPKSSGKTFLSASLVVKGGGRGSRAGAFPFYAGPVRLPAKGKCVMWGGASRTAKWTSGWSHCGK